MVPVSGSCVSWALGNDENMLDISASEVTGHASAVQILLLLLLLLLLYSELVETCCRA